MRLLDNFSVYGSRISDNIYSDSNGQLVISNAILARTGSYDYLESEINPDGDPNKVVKVYRTPEEVFNPYSMASFENKPFCNDHPDKDVDGSNFRELQGGFIRDIRRGTGNLSDCLVGTIVVTDPDMIELIKSKEKRELSLGYNATIEKDGTGKYIMTHIRGNHLALVDNGRAGIATIRDNKTVNNIGGFKGMKINKPAKGITAKDRFIQKLYDTDDVIEVSEVADDEDEDLVMEEECVDIKPVEDDDINVDVTEDINGIKSGIDEIKSMLQEILSKLNANVADADKVEENKDVAIEKVSESESDIEDADEPKPEFYDESVDEEVDEKVDEKIDEDAKKEIEELDDVKDSASNPYAAFANGKLRDSNKINDAHESVKNSFQERYNKIGGKN